MPDAGQVSDSNIPQDVMPKGPGPTPVSQTTTKPRQMPGGPTQPGDGADTEMNPSSNGSDVAPPPPPVQASRHLAYQVADIMAEILDSNPEVGERRAYTLARKVSDDYLSVEAEVWNPLMFGNRPGMPGATVTVPTRKTQVPENSPSRHQPTVQPSHGPLVLDGRPQPKELGAAPPKALGPAPMKGLPRGTDPLDSLDFVMNDEESARNDAIKMKQGEDDVWRMAHRKGRRRNR